MRRRFSISLRFPALTMKKNSVDGALSQLADFARMLSILREPNLDHENASSS